MADFVPDDFEVPRELHGDGFRLEPLTVAHNEADHAAWMSSIDHIHASPGFEDRPWPSEMSLEENAEDLRQHEQDWHARTGFTYTVLDPGGDVIGCVYIYPSDEEQFDAAVRSWVRSDHGELDIPLRRTVARWLERDWPFEEIRYAGVG